MKLFNEDEVKNNIHLMDRSIDEGKVFVYPTDTIYGIGADATNDEAVRKIRDLKNRNDKPFSVIAPSKEWIIENCHVADGDQEWLDKLPGPYTLIMKLKNKSAISSEVNCGMDTVGVRIPDHWISELVSKSGKPIVTTSANKMGENFMTNVEDLDSEIMNNVDYVFYEGELDGRPSTLVNLVDGKVKKR